MLIRRCHLAEINDNSCGIILLKQIHNFVNRNNLGYSSFAKYIYGFLVEFKVDFFIDSTKLL